MQADTVQPNPSDPQQLNRYSYVGNRPLNFTDPTGHAADAGGAWGGITEDPPPPPGDDAGPTFRHLIETSSPKEDPAALFTGYTLKGWNFEEASATESLFAFVYDEGPVSWEEARQAAIEGRPNPLTREQMNQGFKKAVDPTDAGRWAVAGARAGYQYSLLLDRVLGPGAAGNITNYEPQYLLTVIQSHPKEVAKANDLYWEDPFGGGTGLRAPAGAPPVAQPY